VADNPSNQNAASTIPYQLRLALASILTSVAMATLTIAALGCVWFFPSGIFKVALALELVVAILGFGLSICSAVSAYRARMAGTFVLGLIGFVLNGAFAIYSFSIDSFFLNGHGFGC